MSSDSSPTPKLTPTRRTKGVKRDRTLTNPDSSSLRGPRSKKKVPVPGELHVEVFTPADVAEQSSRERGRIGGTDSPSDSRSISPTPRRAPALPRSSPPASGIFGDTSSVQPSHSSRSPSFNPPLNPNIWANTMTSSPPESPLHIGVPVTWSADDFEPETMEEVLVEIIDFVRERGFKSIAHVHQSLHTFSSKWASGSRCYAEVETDWNHGLPELLKEIGPRRKVKGLKEVVEFDHAVIDVASEVLAKETRSFTSVKDVRQSVYGVKPKAPSQKSFLHMTGAEITDDFVRSDVLGECCEVFKSSAGVPLFWSLLSKITSPTNERLVNDRQRQQAMAMGILFHTMNQNLRRIQSMIGMVLHNAGVQDSVKQQMCRIGVSIGIQGISAAVKELTARQAKRLLQIGNNVVDKPHTLVYDNLQYQFNVGAERLDNQRSRIDSTAGFVTEAILSKPDMKLPTKGSFNPDVLKTMGNQHLLSTSYEDAMFKKEVQKQHLRETVLDVFITPLRPKKGQKSNIKPLLLPPKGPKLTDSQARCLKSEFKEFTPLQTMPFNEGTIGGTVAWADSVRQQLGLNAERLEDKVIIAYGDLMTVQNLRSAKHHRAEDGDGLENLQWVHVFFGLFHLRMAIMNIVYVHWRAPKSEDFAHLNAIIEKLHKHGFSNEKKITNFKATEDLLITTYKSYVAAWVVDQVQKEIPDWDNKNPQQRKDAAALILCARGTTWTENNIIEKCFNEMFSDLTRVQDTQMNTREVFHQASELVSIIGLYIDFHDTIKKGKVGKITTLLRLFLPYFAGSSSHRYTKEIATFLSMEGSCDPDTWMFILDNTLIKAKGPGFIEADCRMEHLIRVQKRYLQKKAHDFEKMSADWSLVSGILDSARKALLISTSKQDKEVVYSHAIKSMAMDILSLSTAIIDDGIISNRNKQVDVPTVGLCRKGNSMLQSFDMREVYDSLFNQSILTGDTQQGEYPLETYIVDTDTVDVVGAHDDDEDILDNNLNEVDVDPEPTFIPFNPILNRVRASGHLGIKISPK